MQIVLGAGLSGLSLAVALVRAGVREPIVVVDRRTTFGRDRTWCAWAAPDTPFLDLATHRWHTWKVRTAAGTASATSADRPYVHLPSDVFYAAALAELDAAPNVELRLGEAVLDVGDGWARTDAGNLTGTVHDGRATEGTVPSFSRAGIRGQSPHSHERESGDGPLSRTGLWQTFLGWEVETAAPAFDPGVATLMDYRTPQHPGGVHFVYTLPFSQTRALVEHTSFAPEGVATADREAALRAHLPEAFEIVHKERGRLPMSAVPQTALPFPRTTAIGIAGGALRASSGYAFSRVQAHSRAIARAVVDGTPLPRRAGVRRRGALDAVFLRALAADPGAFPEHFRTLVERVPADVFARFMSDHSTAADEARVMAALPVAPFARSAGRVAVDRVLARRP